MYLYFIIVLIRNNKKCHKNRNNLSCNNYSLIQLISLSLSFDEFHHLFIISK